MGWYKRGSQADTLLDVDSIAITGSNGTSLHDISLRLPIL